jgi:signal transduction histidine kinase
VVEDNGPGIPDSRKSAIFERTLGRLGKYTGKGLGLTLVKTLIDDYNGRIWVEDRITGESSKGCRFVILLPIHGSEHDDRLTSRNS